MNAAGAIPHVSITVFPRVRAFRTFLVLTTLSRPSRPGRARVPRTLERFRADKIHKTPSAPARPGLDAARPSAPPAAAGDGRRAARGFARPRRTGERRRYGPGAARRGRRRGVRQVRRDVRRYGLHEARRPVRVDRRRRRQRPARRRGAAQPGQGQPDDHAGPQPLRVRLRRGPHRRVHGHEPGRCRRLRRRRRPAGRPDLRALRQSPRREQLRAPVQPRRRECDARLLPGGPRRPLRHRLVGDAGLRDHRRRDDGDDAHGARTLQLPRRVEPPTGPRPREQLHQPHPFDPEGDDARGRDHPAHRADRGVVQRCLVPDVLRRHHQRPRHLPQELGRRRQAERRHRPGRHRHRRGPRLRHLRR